MSPTTKRRRQPSAKNLLLEAPPTTSTIFTQNSHWSFAELADLSSCHKLHDRNLKLIHKNSTLLQARSELEIQSKLNELFPLDENGSATSNSTSKSTHVPPPTFIPTEQTIDILPLHANRVMSVEQANRLAESELSIQFIPHLDQNFCLSYDASWELSKSAYEETKTVDANRVMSVEQANRLAESELSIQFIPHLDQNFCLSYDASWELSKSAYEETKTVVKLYNKDKRTGAKVWMDESNGLVQFANCAWVDNLTSKQLIENLKLGGLKITGQKQELQLRLKNMLRLKVN